MQLVLDTNVVLDVLVFRDPAVRPLVDDLAAGRVQWLATASMREELARVLAYPKLAARVAHHRKGPQAVLADFDRLAVLVDPPAKAAMVCRDPDDQKFIDLAVARGCSLLSKDQDVLRMTKRLARVQVTAGNSWPL